MPHIVAAAVCCRRRRITVSWRRSPLAAPALLLLLAQMRGTLQRLSGRRKSTVAVVVRCCSLPTSLRMRASGFWCPEQRGLSTTPPPLCPRVSLPVVSQCPSVPAPSSLRPRSAVLQAEPAHHPCAGEGQRWRQRSKSRTTVRLAKGGARSHSKAKVQGRSFPQTSGPSSGAVAAQQRTDDEVKREDRAADEEHGHLDVLHPHVLLQPRRRLLEAECIPLRRGYGRIQRFSERMFSDQSRVTVDYFRSTVRLRQSAGGRAWRWSVLSTSSSIFSPLSRTYARADGYGHG